LVVEEEVSSEKGAAYDTSLLWGLVDRGNPVLRAVGYPGWYFGGAER